MCTDFTDLNKCCPKDDFPLIRIDKVVDSAVGCEALSLLDCFSGYPQIRLHKDDEEKTSFITPFGTYCYLRMPKGLKNVGLMFGRMTKAILNDQMQINVFAYVDDIVVASRKKATQIEDLAETFTNMRSAELKLIQMCVWHAVGQGLDYLVSMKGIEANPDKINAILHMKPLRSKKKFRDLLVESQH
jgi:hypothetical protein